MARTTKSYPSIYTEFCQKHPGISKDVAHKIPYGYMTIKIFMWDHSIMFYNAETGKVTRSDEKWVNL